MYLYANYTQSWIPKNDIRAPANPKWAAGAPFATAAPEPEAKLCDGCFKLHETAWLDEYPVNMPSDIVEVRFKNTRRSFYQNVNNLDARNGATS